jgi:hypothetical protein
VTTHPVARAALGEAVADMARHSTYDFSPQVRPGAALDLVTVTEPVALAYTGRGRGFTLPPGRFLPPVPMPPTRCAPPLRSDGQPRRRAYQTWRPVAWT